MRTFICIVAVFAAASATLPAFPQAASLSDISVCRDATYSIDIASRGAICAGDGIKPVGTACPKRGDATTKACLPYLPTFDGGRCVAKEDAQCMIVSGSTWGCVFPTIGCQVPLPKPTKVSCPSWEFNATTGDIPTQPILSTVNGTPTPTLSAREHSDWFTQETPLEIIVCGTKVTIPKPTPAPTTFDPPTPAPSKPTPAPTAFPPPTPAPSKPTPAPTTTGVPETSKPTPAPTPLLPESGKPTPASTTVSSEIGKPTPTSTKQDLLLQQQPKSQDASPEVLAQEPSSVTFSDLEQTNNSSHVGTVVVVVCVALLAIIGAVGIRVHRSRREQRSLHDLNDLVLTPR